MGGTGEGEELEQDSIKQTPFQRRISLQGRFGLGGKAEESGRGGKKKGKPPNKKPIIFCLRISVVQEGEGRGGSNWKKGEEERELEATS